MPSSYKVPQDVEAEDKLLGPFSFRQFIFLIIAAAMVAAAWGLYMLLPPLVIIPVPIAILFAILALPLKKDQPMEVYLMAVISFLLKPKARLWRADGIETMVEVIAPPVVDEHLTKDYTQGEIQQRLSYLANLVDTGGWSVRGVDGAPQINQAMQSDLYNEAMTAQDMMDDTSEQGQAIDTLINKTNEDRRREAIERMKKAQEAARQPASPYDNLPDGSELPQPTPTAAPQPAPDENVQFNTNPYPTMRQSVVLTPEERAAQAKAQAEAAAQQHTKKQPESTSELHVSPAIMDLANNHSDLSVEAIQHEANRLKQKQLDDGEVVISLR